MLGEAEAHRAAAKLRAGTRDTKREYLAAVRVGLRPMQTEVRAGVPRYLPSGYAPVLSKSLRLVTAAASGEVEVRARAKGRKGHDRDIGRMERGMLRAPSWPRGKRAGWSWHGQRVRPGFFSEPIRRRKDEIKAAIRDAMHRIARRSV